MELPNSLNGEQVKDIARRIDSLLSKAMVAYPEVAVYQDRSGYYHILTAYDFGYNRGKRGWKRLNPYGGDE